MTDSPSVRRLEAGAADDADLVAELASLINDVYATAERGRGATASPGRLPPSSPT
jgi:hypothetical protein